MENAEETAVRVTRSQRKRLTSVESDVSRSTTPTLQKLNTITEIGSPSRPLRRTRRLSGTELIVGTPSKLAATNTPDVNSPSVRLSARKRSLSNTVADELINNSAKSAVARRPKFDALMEEKENTQNLSSTPSRRMTRSQSISPPQPLELPMIRKRKSVASKINDSIAEETIEEEKQGGETVQPMVFEPITEAEVVGTGPETQKNKKDEKSLAENSKSVVFNETIATDDIVAKTVYPKTPMNSMKSGTCLSKDMNISNFNDSFGHASTKQNKPEDGIDVTDMDISLLKQNVPESSTPIFSIKIKRFRTPENDSKTPSSQKQQQEQQKGEEKRTGKNDGNNMKNSASKTNNYDDHNADELNKNESKSSIKKSNSLLLQSFENQKDNSSKARKSLTKTVLQYSDDEKDMEKSTSQKSFQDGNTQKTPQSHKKATPNKSPNKSQSLLLNYFNKDGKLPCSQKRFPLRVSDANEQQEESKQNNNSNSKPNTPKERRNSMKTVYVDVYDNDDDDSIDKDQKATTENNNVKSFSSKQNTTKERENSPKSIDYNTSNDVDKALEISQQNKKESTSKQNTPKERRSSLQIICMDVDIDSTGKDVENKSISSKLNTPKERKNVSKSLDEGTSTGVDKEKEVSKENNNNSSSKENTPEVIKKQTNMEAEKTEILQNKTNNSVDEQKEQQNKVEKMSKSAEEIKRTSLQAWGMAVSGKVGDKIDHIENNRKATPKKLNESIHDILIGSNKKNKSKSLLLTNKSLVDNESANDTVAEVNNYFNNALKEEENVSKIDVIDTTERAQSASQNDSIVTEKKKRKSRPLIQVLSDDDDDYDNNDVANDTEREVENYVRIEEDDDEELAEDEKPYKKNAFIKGSVIEVDAEYLSGDSMDSEERAEIEDNEIIHDGESLGSEDTDIDEQDDSDDENDSFIESDAEMELLDTDDDVANEDDRVTNESASQKKKKTSFNRFVSVSSDSEDEQVEDQNKNEQVEKNNEDSSEGEIQDDEDQEDEKEEIIKSPQLDTSTKKRQTKEKMVENQSEEGGYYNDGASGAGATWGSSSVSNKDTQQEEEEEIEAVFSNDDDEENSCSETEDKGEQSVESQKKDSENGKKQTILSISTTRKNLSKTDSGVVVFQASQSFAEIEMDDKEERKKRKRMSRSFCAGESLDISSMMMQHKHKKSRVVEPADEENEKAMDEEENEEAMEEEENEEAVEEEENKEAVEEEENEAMDEEQNEASMDGGENKEALEEEENEAAMDEEKELETEKLVKTIKNTSNDKIEAKQVKSTDEEKYLRIQARIKELLEASDKAKQEAKLNAKKNAVKMPHTKKKKQKIIEQLSAKTEMESEANQEGEKPHEKAKIKEALHQALKASTDILFKKDRKTKQALLNKLKEDNLKTQRCHDETPLSAPAIKKKKNKDFRETTPPTRTVKNKLSTAAGEVAILPVTPPPNPKKNRVQEIKLSTGVVRVEPSSPVSSRVVKKTNVGILRDDPSTPRTIGFKVRQIFNCGQDEIPELSHTNKRGKKRKRVITELTYSLPQPEWTSSGVFKVETQQQVFKASTGKKVLVTALSPNGTNNSQNNKHMKKHNNKNVTKYFGGGGSIESALQFKKQVLQRNDVPRESPLDLINRKKRQELKQR